MPSHIRNSAIMYLRRINTRIKHRPIDNIDGEAAAAEEVITCHQFMYETTKEAGVWITNNCMGTVCVKAARITLRGSCLCRRGFVHVLVCVCVCVCALWCN